MFSTLKLYIISIILYTIYIWSFSAYFAININCKHILLILSSPLSMHSTWQSFNYSPCLPFSFTLSPSGCTYLLPAVALTFSISLICLLSSVHCSLFTVHSPLSSTLPGTRQFAFYDICFARVSLAFCSRVLGQKTFYSDCQLQLHCLLFPASLSHSPPAPQLITQSSANRQFHFANRTTKKLSF